MTHVPLGMILSAQQVTYVPIPKAGSTSMLWTIAELQGEQLARRGVSLEPEIGRSLLVHDAALWQNTGTIETMKRRELEAMCADEDWFVFTLTRHPVDRLFAAWESKLLCREPSFVWRFGHEPWFPSKPTSGDAIAADFGRFVTALKDDAGLRRADRHWQSQTEVLHTDWMRYTHVGRTSAYAETLAALEQHLQRRGRFSTVKEHRENEGLLALKDVDLSPSLIALIEDMYTEDMTKFGYEPRRLDSAPVTLSAQVVRALRAILDRNERIGDLLAVIRSSDASQQAS